MLFTAFAELLSNWRSIYTSITGLLRKVNVRGNALKRQMKSKANTTEDSGVATEKSAQVEDKNSDDDAPVDPVPPELQVPSLWWMGGLAVSVVFTCKLANLKDI
jgi:hypothetical protein